jgi:hypothetical protein
MVVLHFREANRYQKALILLRKSPGQLIATLENQAPRLGKPAETDQGTLLAITV